MGLIDMLTSGKSNLTPYNGTTPQTNPLSTAQSNMHADASGAPGYSINGSDSVEVNKNYQSYLDGVSNILPQPSQLDLGGVDPKISTVPNSTQAYPYSINTPK